MGRAKRGQKETIASPQTSLFLRITKSNAFKRTILGMIMLKMFILLCKHHKLNIIIFVICLTLGICYELISLVRKNNEPFAINPILTVFYVLVLYTMRVTPTLVKVYPNLEKYRLIAGYSPISFYAYAAALILFIFSLRKRRLTTQLILFSIIHIASYVLGSCCAYSIMNIERGQFYFFYPCILVISNDIFAYVIGRLVGRTPLYSLSPNKTVEGFIGASFFTFLTGMLLVYLKLYYNFLPDMLDKEILVPLRSDVWYLNFPVMFLHNIFFSLYASFIAPFIGFFASAVKRAFHKKDFGAVIPGHGGLTDRMDCQLLMVFFTHFYLNSFIRSRKESVEYLSTHILSVYTSEEVKELISKLGF
ncbi:phosphatidate cytidylyltransferase [Pancytospora epiphaga]|nr:phosphatidate cytidylyltransferase [Pancytospora epiphaga]